MSNTIDILEKVQVNYLISVSEFWDCLGQHLLKITTTTFRYVALKVVITLLENLLKVNVRYKTLYGKMRRKSLISRHMKISLNNQISLTEMLACSLT